MSLAPFRVAFKYGAVYFDVRGSSAVREHALSSINSFPVAPEDDMIANTDRL